MFNLTNIYAYLRDKYADVNMFYGKAPSFVKTLAGLDDQKIIFIYKEDALKISHSSPTNDSGNNFNCSELSGSPLKDDNSINDLINTSVASKICTKNPWKDSEERFAPVDETLAREILSEIANSDFAANSRGWIFILCTKKTSHYTNFLLSLQVSKSFTRGLANYYHTDNEKIKTVECFLEKQNLLVPRAKSEARIESVFEITPYISLKFLNTMPAENLTLSHINQMSQIQLFQKVEIGKSHQLCEQLWNQIQLLYMIKNDIVNIKNNSFDGTLAEASYNYGSMKYEELQQKVNEVLSDVEIINETADEPVDVSLESVLKRVSQRPLIETTDKLWEILKFGSSYTDLRKILTFIFQISSRSSIVNIPMNNNRLAELIREISQQRLSIPNLSSTEPLELLLEIGIEKVLKDYEFLYSESKICVLSDINIRHTIPSQPDGNMNVRKSLAASFVDKSLPGNRKTLLHGPGTVEANDDLDGIRNSRFNEKDTELSISKMAQIHIAIEHILMMQNNLNMENDYKQIAKKILENKIISFEDLQTQKYDKLQIQINDKKAIQLVDNLMPNSRKVIIKSENKFKCVENVYYFNIEQIVPSLVRKDCDSEEKADNFHFINYTMISSKY